MFYKNVLQFKIRRDIQGFGLDASASVPQKLRRKIEHYIKFWLDVGGIIT